MHMHPVYGVPHVLEYGIERHQQITTAHTSFFPIYESKTLTQQFMQRIRRNYLEHKTRIHKLYTYYGYVRHSTRRHIFTKLT